MYVKQHYDPQFYLKSFATRKVRRYKIKCYNKESGNEFKENIRNIGMENYFYDKGGPPQIETLFANKEKIHSKVYQKIISQKSIAKINSEEKYNKDTIIDWFTKHLTENKQNLTLDWLRGQKLTFESVNEMRKP